MKIIACGLTVIACATAGSAFARQDQPFREGIETRYIAATPTTGVFIGKIYGSPPKVTTTIWTFLRTPAKYQDASYNTAATVADIDCAARTLKRTSVMVLQGELFGQDRTSRVVGRGAITEAATNYASGTVFGVVIDQACASAPIDDKKNPAFQTLSQARSFGFYMSGQAGK